MSEYTNSWILHLGVLLYGKTERKVIMQSQYENFIQARNKDVSIQELCEQFNISKSTGGVLNLQNKSRKLKLVADNAILLNISYSSENISDSIKIKTENGFYLRSKCRNFSQKWKPPPKNWRTAGICNSYLSDVMVIPSEDKMKFVPLRE